MGRTFVTKRQLKRVAKLNKRILQFLPEGDSMRETYVRMSKFLDDRIATYDQFRVNPYTVTTSQLKYNTERELGLGEYHNKDRGDLEK